MDQPLRSIALLNESTRQDLIKRIRRIEGQARGIERMIREGRDCLEVMNQLSALRAAAYSATLHLAEQYTRQCLVTLESEEEREKAIHQMLRFLVHVPH